MSHNLGGMTQNRLGGMCPPDFKPPDQASQHVTSAPSNPKKRRKTSNANAIAVQQQPPTTPQDLLPPPLSGYGDTIVASNPFDDTPSTSSMGPSHHGGPGVGGGPGMMNMVGMHGMNPHGMPPHQHPGHPHHMHNHHMGGPPIRGMHPMNMNPMMNHPMNAGPNAHMNSRPAGQMPGMNSMGNMNHNMSSMGPMGPMPHMGGVPSPHIGMNSPNMGANGGRLGSPMGSGASGGSGPLGSPLGGNPGAVPHLSNSPMGPPMHSPLGNGPMHMPPSQPGSRINVSNGSPLNANTGQPHGNMSPLIGGPGNGPNLSHHPQQSDQLLNSMGPHQHPHSHPHPHMSQQSPVNSGPGGVGQDQNNLINNSEMMAMNHQSNHHLNSLNALNGPLHQPNHQMGGMYGGPPGPKPMSMSAGKVYPPNQPMVFNPQNPSAPPIYTCGMCHKEINDNDEEALFCESGCNFFFHRPCTGLTEVAYQFIKKEIFAEWCCDKCLATKNVPLVKFKC